MDRAIVDLYTDMVVSHILKKLFLFNLVKPSIHTTAR